MGRFFSGIGGQGSGIGSRASVLAVLLSAQGYFTGKFRSALAFSNLRATSFSLHYKGECNPLGMADTGLVTFAVYECDEGKEQLLRPQGGCRRQRNGAIPEPGWLDRMRRNVGL
jgi:hypothetical protein